MPHENSPRFLKGPYRIALRTALEEINVKIWGVRNEVETLLAPSRLLLHRGPRGGTITKQKLFNSGAWLDLLEESQKVTHAAAQVRRRRNRRTEDDLTRRVSRAEALVHGEVSSGRQALEGASLAPGSEATLNALKDPAKRPPEPRTPLPRISRILSPSLRSTWINGCFSATCDQLSDCHHG